MNIGLFGARSSNSGLGTQTWEFYKNMNPAATVVVDISKIDGKRVYPERFMGSNVVTYDGFPRDKFIDDWLAENKNLDVIFCCEIPYNYYLFTAARKLGIRTVLQYNYEFLDYIPKPSLPYPDVLASPSIWHIEDVQARYWAKTKVDLLQVPVNTSLIERRFVSKLNTFVHVAGYELHEDRNGTNALLDAIPHVKSDVKFIIYSQHKIPTLIDSRVSTRATDFDNYWDLYSCGDALIYPRRYGGLTLPAQEAVAAGMLVSMPKVSPNFHNSHLLSQINISGMKKTKMRCGEIDYATFDPLELAAHIDRLHGYSVFTVAEICDHQYERLPKWDDYRNVYLEYFRNTKVFSNDVTPVCVSEVNNLKVAKVKILRTFSRKSKTVSYGQELFFDLQEAKQHESRHNVQILEILDAPKDA